MPRNEGFQLNPHEMSQSLGRDLSTPGAHLSVYLDAYARADFDTGLSVVSDPVDRAVVVFVGSREQAAAVEAAARQVLAASSTEESPGNSLRPATPAAAVRDRLPASPPAGDTTVAAGPHA